MYEKQKKEEKKNAYWGGWLDGWKVGLHAMRLENDIQIMRVSLNKLRYFFFWIDQSIKKKKKRMCVVCGVWCVVVKTLVYITS